jgi:S-adenosylmethionine:tRNA ribosyltransferase-isomerase
MISGFIYARILALRYNDRHCGPIAMTVIVSHLSMLKQYQYTIQEKSIRKEPLNERDTSRIFVYDTATDTITFDYFYNLAKYTPEHTLLVLNDTGVIPARVTFKKQTGGKVKGLILLNEGLTEEGEVGAIVDRKITPGQDLYIDSHHFKVTRQEESKFFLKPMFAETISEVLLHHGTTPTPPYLGKQSLDEESLRTRYQTIFSKEKKSVAAPTASLHFTERVFARLKEKDVTSAYITLDVGLGTFAEVKEEQVQSRTLHKEHVFISSETCKQIQEQKKNRRPVLAVGTTAVRTLESQKDHILQGVGSYQGDTSLFILPPYDFKIVDHMITNFHVPGSSLMALVDAFLLHKKAKRRILELYEVAQQEGFTFYSFGDSMVII